MRDYWLFDSVRLLEMNYTSTGAFVSARVNDDPSAIEEACHLRDLALRLSVPYAEFAADLDERMRRT